MRSLPLYSSITRHCHCGLCLPDVATNWTDERLAGCDTESRLYALQAQGLPQLKSSEKCAIRLILMRHVGTKDDLWKAQGAYRVQCAKAVEEG